MPVIVIAAFAAMTGTAGRLKAFLWRLDHATFLFKRYFLGEK
jgi:hypothetical protein